MLDQRSPSFRPDVQVLRAIAVLLVILFHAKVPGFNAGFLGVDIFFVISGFWMSQIILNQLDTGNFTFKNFYERRMRRILPALFFTLLLTFFVAWFELWPRDFDTLSEVMASAVLFLANAVIKNQASDYFAPELDSHPLLHIWSLSLEEQYYLIFPLLALLIFKLPKVASNLVFILIPVISFWGANLFYYQNPTAVFYHLPTRLWEFWLGYAAAIWIFQKRNIDPKIYYVAMFGLVGSLFFVNQNSVVPGWGSLIACLSVAIILAKNSQPTPIFYSKYLSILVWIGGLSYSLYLLHQPILSFARLRGLDEPLYLFLLVMVVGLFFSVLMKRYIEDSFRNEKIIPKKIFALTVVFTGGLIIGLAYWSVSTNGIPSRFDGLLESITKTAHGNPERKYCHDNEVKDACIHVLDVTPTVAVLGDSHADVLAYAVGEFLSDTNQSALHLSVSGCGFFDKRERCNAWYQDAIKRIASDKEIGTVIISTRIAGQLHGNHKDIWPDVPDLTSLDHQKNVLSAYRAVFERLIKANKKVIWVLQAPEVGPKLEVQMRKALDNFGNASSVSRDWWSKRMAKVRAFAEEQKQNIQLYDPEEVFCGEQECFSVKDGVTLYRDRDHMSLSAARKIVAGIKQQL